MFQIFDPITDGQPYAPDDYEEHIPSGWGPGTGRNAKQAPDAEGKESGVPDAEGADAIMKAVSRGAVVDDGSGNIPGVLFERGAPSAGPGAGAVAGDIAYGGGEVSKVGGESYRYISQAQGNL